ncbi:MAG: 6-phosphogluconolactonase [Methylovulum sp.]|uniref:6-phosphogluconolactonase n=1 Tax=Methylovulum sp. TaxID=1916980 RepID=UPI00262CDA3F|nr:6-phosphogluconolactonase [Methylovulum sp.]MDD2723730.1 6-phosphogluconolactonase [Methylovulum sp.]MDD5125347.1 6-phosphogluconolactonase [Methylovulum sp.]
MQENSRWHTLASADDVAAVASQHILKSAQQAIAERGQFKLVLAGGTTPEKIYRLLAKTDADWANWVIYYGDERCLPADDAERNSMIAKTTLLDHVPIPDAQIFTMQAELGGEHAAGHYRPIVAAAMPFDMVLLGMGEDGHTASLFPGHVHNEDELVHAVYNSPKPPPKRVSISAKALSNTHELLFLITGVNKREIVKAWRAGENLPIATIQPENTLDIYIDSDALPA